VQIEEQLRASLKELRDLKAALDEHAIVAITDPQGRITYVNDRFCAISKYPREELIGKDHRIINSGFHSKEFIRGLWATIGRGNVWRGEIRNRARDGTLYWVDTTIVPFLDENGRPRQYVAIRADITERKQNEAAVARLAAIVESSDDAIIGKDLSGVVTSWNAGAERIFGYPAHEMLGQSILRLIPEDRRHEETEILGRIRCGESIRHFETRRMRKDGRLIDVSVTVSAVRDSAGAIIGASKVARDITEDKEVEERLRTSLKEVGDLKAALDEHAIVAMTDPQGRITYVNDKFCAISKYSREELLGQDHRIINSGHHDKGFIRELWATIGHGRVWHGELMNRAKDGTHYWVDTTIVPFLDGRGKPRQYVAIRADITDRKRVEEALREGQARLNFALQASQIGAWELSLKDHSASRNLIHDKIFGYEKELPEWTYERFLGHVVPEDRGRVDASFREATSADSPWDFECRIRRVDGEVRWIRAAGDRERDSEGNTSRMSGIVQDITVQKGIEEEIRMLNVELEKRVVERTAQLEAANKELEAFSYSVSHDLRSPLRAIDGFSQAVLEDYGSQVPGEGLRYLRTIRESAQRMSALIDDLLAFARLGRTSLNKREVDTERMVRGVLEELGSPWSGRQVEVRIDGLPPSSGDPLLLKQVWVNLLSNALKYTGKRERALIEIGCTAGPGTRAFFVRDNGTGFDMRFADRLFGVFQRLHRAEDYEGTGVGLAIVQRIVTRHGGRVWAEAEVDRGATFHFTLERDQEP
jgi:PAS domain S-box-containing protein